eukprot:5317694-Amphidinium_carterae.1
MSPSNFQKYTDFEQEVSETAVGITVKMSDVCSSGHRVICSFGPKESLSLNAPRRYYATASGVKEGSKTGAYVVLQ